MATVKEIYSRLNELIPRTLSCSWDNDGLLICPDGNKEVKSVLLALDATKSVCDAAQDVDLILTHHPIIFRKIGEVSDQTPISAKAVRLIKSGTAVMSFHTRFDACDGGINDILAEKFGLADVEKFGIPGEAEMGRVGNIPEMSAKELALKIKKILGAPTVFYTDTGKPVSRVAICGGDGASMIYPALSAGADVLVTGRGGYNANVDARDAGICVIEAGHYYSEQIFAEYFERFFGENYPEIKVSRQNIGCEILSV